MRQILETLTAFLIWAGLATASGFLMGAISPHGMAGFIHSSVVLGLVGGFPFPALSNLTGHDLDGRSRICVGSGIGAGLGGLSFFISTVIAERTLHLPHDSFQLALLACLCALGASLGGLTVMAQRGLKRLHRGDC